MSIFKQSYSKTYIKAMLAVVEKIKNLRGIEIEEHSYYNECVRMMSNVNMNVDGIDVLFDYYYFKYGFSEKDCSKDLKVLFKEYKVSPDDILLYVKSLSSYCLRLEDFPNKYYSEKLMPCVSLLSGFCVFLIYSFDIAFSNKKLELKDIKCKFRDLDCVVDFISSKNRIFKNKLDKTLISLSCNNIDLCGKKFEIDIELLPSQKYHLKHDIILMQSLLNKLLCEENDVYLGRFKLNDYILDSISSNIKEQIFNYELSNEFYSLLRKRAYLIPSSGVSISYNEFEIDLFERQLDGNNYLVCIVNKKDHSYFTIINLTESFTLNVNPFLVELCSVLCSFYKMSDKPVPSVLNFKMDRFISDGAESIETFIVNQEDIVVKSPYYWRLSNKDYTSGLSVEGLKMPRSEVYISAFKRKLPSGYKASDEAVSMSKLYCIDLEEGETLVSPFIRNSKKKVVV